MEKSRIDKIQEVFQSLINVIKQINASVVSTEDKKDSANEELDVAFANAYSNGEADSSISSRRQQDQAAQPTKTITRPTTPNRSIFLSNNQPNRDGR